MTDYPLTIPCAHISDIGPYGTLYTLFDGLADNTRGYFTSCLVFFRGPQGRGKMRATSKMSASIICKTVE